MRNPASSSDEELMARYQRGDAEAFKALYERYAGRLMGYLMGRLGNRAVADDVFQGVFMNLHRSRSRYSADLPFAPWLFTIARNACLDAHRKTAQIKESPDDSALESARAPEASEPVESPALRGLAADQRRALEMRYQEELPYEQIARRLSTTPGNARKLVSRAIQKLRSTHEKP